MMLAGHDLSDISVFDQLRRSAARFADTDLLAMPGWLAERWGLDRTGWTYGEILREVEALARAYDEAGYGLGHRVALLLENRPSFFRHYLALNSLGAALVPINPDLTRDEMAYILGHSDAVLGVALPERRVQLAEAAEATGLKVIVDGEAPPRAQTPAHTGLPITDATEAALLYTSGTTGRPKGCILPNGHFLSWGEWYLAQPHPIALRPGAERLLQPLPTFHINGMGNSFIGMLASGGTQILLDRFHPRSWWADARETRATCFHYLGVMPAMLLSLPEDRGDRDHDLRYGVGGGVHPNHHARFEARFNTRLLEGWAMTETGGAGIMCAVTAPRHIGHRCIGHPARPGPPMEALVVDDDHRPVAPGAEGELLVRAAGPDPRRRFFAGYLKDPEATEAAWRGGWLNTGDIVRRDAVGHLFFVDRKKNIIRRSGENISATEVEGVVNAHPLVRQCGVVAVLDEMRGEEVLAVVVPGEGAPPPAELAAALFAHSGTALAYYKVPGWIAVRDSLPTTATQKVRKAELGAVAQDPATAPDCYDFRDRKQALRRG